MSRMADLFKIPTEGYKARAGLNAGVRWEDVVVWTFGEMHLWVVRINERESCDIERAKLLSTAEVERAARYESNLHRACFLQRRTAQRIVLAAYLDISPQDVVYETNEFGKPSVRFGQGSTELSFNASHSGTIALIAIVRSGRIGVDVERLRPSAEDEAVATRFFTTREAAKLAALSAEDRITGFFNAWTRKEALVKALGRGLSIPLDSFEVSLRPDEPPAILRWNVPSAAPVRWRMHHLEPAPGYVAAVVFENEREGSAA
jgi:4'-phosphopantetheinyl transferase